MSRHANPKNFTQARRFGQLALGVFWIGVIVLTGTLNGSDLPYQIEQTVDETRVRVVALDQQVQVRDLLAGLSDSAEWDGKVLTDHLPRGDLNLSKSITRATLELIEKLTQKKARFDIEFDHQQVAQALIVRLDRARIEQDRRAKLSDLRTVVSVAGQLTGQTTSDLKWGLRGLDQEESPQRIVILVHGLQGSHDSLNGLMAHLSQDGFACGTFAYPNDGPIELSAQLFSHTLRQLKTPPGTHISLVTHSMGGLVSRWMIETPEEYDTRIDQLIAICPPNHGSNMAYLPPGMDLHEHLHDRPVSELPEFIFRSSIDGFNEAAHDLRPQSRFLLKLNQRPRNSHVQYSILLGNSSPATAQQLDLVADRIKNWSQRSDTFRFLSSRIRKALDHPLEMTPGEGDGAVAVVRGKLDGVSDTVVLPIDHWTAPDHIESEAGQLLVGEIRQRLKK